MNISPAMVDSALRTQTAMREAWNSAKVQGGRINWPRELITDICALIAAGTHSVRRACEVHHKSHNAFLRLALRDPEVKDEYDLALQIRAENLADEVVEISDDDGKDLDWDGKPNNAAVRRSELRIKTRMQLAGAANPGRYRERGAPGPAVNVQQNVQNNLNVQVNLNHAERLAAARRRKMAARKAQGVPVIDAKFTEAKQEPDDDWMESGD